VSALCIGIDPPYFYSGKITDIKVTPAANGTQEATVTFEKETAAKTAQLLNNTQLGPSQISVTTADGKADDGTPHTTNADRDTDEITQEEKPRSRILAEYLAHGYVVGDAAIQRAIELDHKQYVIPSVRPFFPTDETYETPFWTHR